MEAPREDIQVRPTAMFMRLQQEDGGRQRQKKQPQEGLIILLREERQHPAGKMQWRALPIQVVDTLLAILHQKADLMKVPAAAPIAEREVRVDIVVEIPGAVVLPREEIVAAQLAGVLVTQGAALVELLHKILDRNPDGRLLPAGFTNILA